MDIETQILLIIFGVPALLVLLWIIFTVWDIYDNTKSSKKKSTTTASTNVNRSSNSTSYRTDMDRVVLRNALLIRINEIQSSDVYFSKLYDDTLRFYGTDRQYVKRSFHDNLDFEKTRFLNVCERLLIEAKTNVCFMDESMRVSRGLGVSHISDDRITQDVTRALPIMAEFYSAYSYLYTEVYWNTYVGIVQPCSMLLFGNFRLGAMHEIEVTNEDLQASNAFMKKVFDSEVDAVIDSVLPKVSCSRETLARYSEQIVEDDELYEKYGLAWITKLHEIGKDTVLAGVDLWEFLKNIEAKMKKELPWFSISLFKFPSTYILLREKTSEECLRVLNLYKYNNWRGRYSYFYENSNGSN